MSLASAPSSSPQKKILLTGCTGFIGTTLVKRLIEQGFYPILLVRKKADLNRFDEWKGSLAVLQVNFEDGSSIEGALSPFKGMNFEGILYALGATKANKKEDYDRVNAQYLITFYHAIDALQIKYERFLFMSSLAVHGPQQKRDNVITLNTPFHPATYYAMSKVLAEDFVIKNIKNYIIIRPAAVYGAYDKETLPLYKVVDRFGFFVAFCSKENRVGFVHVADLCTHVIYLLQEGMKNKIVFSCTHNATVKEYSECIAKSVGRQRVFAVVVPKYLLIIMATLNQMFFKLFSDRAPMLNRQKVNELAGECWACDTQDFDGLVKQGTISLEQRIQETVDWYKANRWM